MILSGRLAGRLALRQMAPVSRLEWVAALASLMAAMFSVVAVCVGIGAVDELLRHDTVLMARTPVMSADSDSRSFVCPIVQNTQFGSLDVLRFGANASAAAPPPGAPWPTEGSVWVSPKLMELLAGDDPLVKALVAGQVAGIIGNEALTGPDDLLAYIGISSSTVEKSACTPATGFGVHAADGRDMSVRLVTLISLGSVGLGAIVFLLACAQLMAGVRQRRLAACILIGMRPGVLSLAGALNSGAWALVGVGLGVAALWPVGHLLASWPTFGVAHWATVALVPWATRVAVAVTVLILAVVLGSLTSLRDAWAVRRRVGEHTEASLWRLLPLIASAVLVMFVLLTSLRVGSQQASYMSGEATYTLLASLCLGVIGLAAAQPVVTRLLYPLAAGAPLALRLAVARFTHSSSATRWFALGMAVGILGLGMSAGMTSGMTGRLQTQPGAQGLVLVDLPPKQAWAEPAAFHDAVDQIFQSHSVVWVTASDWLTPEASIDPAVPPTLPTARPLVDPVQLSDTEEVQAAMSWADASAVVAIAVTGWQDRSVFPSFTVLSQDLDQANRLMMQVVSLGLVLAIGLAAFAVGAALVGLQARRDDADAALLAVGVPRGTLVAVRGWEAVVAALPLGVVAMVLSCLAAIGFQHVDDATLPIDWAMLAPIVMTPLVVTGLAALAAVASTPSADRALVRRD